MRLIDADALVEDIDKKIDEEIRVPLGDNHKFFFCAGMRYVVRLVKRLPTVDPVKHGHWIKRNTVGTATCSICGGIIYNSYDSEANKYCPNCGAKMDGDAND